MFKKLTTILMAVIFATLGTGVFSACNNSDQNQDDRIKIVTTTFACYDWVNEILGDRRSEFNVICLTDGGVDSHSFQPTVDDIATVAGCDLLIYVGGQSEAWVEDALKQKTNDRMQVVNLTNLLKDYLLCNDDEGESHDHDHDHDHEYDEHVWLSLSNVLRVLPIIATKIVKLMGDSSIVFSGLKDFCDKIIDLNARYESAVENADVKTLVFCDRFPFRYLLNDYGIAHYAAFSGCSAESEASFETIAGLADKVDSLGLWAVVTIEGGGVEIANAVINSTKSKNAKIVTMNSMQSVTKQQMSEGLSYLSVMESNLEALKTALYRGGENGSSVL